MGTNNLTPFMHNRHGRRLWVSVNKSCGIRLICHVIYKITNATQPLVKRCATAIAEMQRKINKTAEMRKFEFAFKHRERTHEWHWTVPVRCVPACAMCMCFIIIKTLALDFRPKIFCHYTHCRRFEFKCTNKTWITIKCLPLPVPVALQLTQRDREGQRVRVSESVFGALSCQSIV